jgi:hypothetical protein
MNTFFHGRAIDLEVIRAFDNVITITANDREVAPPTRFPARVHVGDSIQFVAQNGERMGVPLGFHEHFDPTLLSFNGGVVPVWGGWAGVGSGCWKCRME